MKNLSDDFNNRKEFLRIILLCSTLVFTAFSIGDYERINGIFLAFLISGLGYYAILSRPYLFTEDYEQLKPLIGYLAGGISGGFGVFIYTMSINDNSFFLSLLMAFTAALICGIGLLSPDNSRILLEKLS